MPLNLRTRVNKQREATAQVRLLASLERAAARGIAREIARVGGQAAAAFKAKRDPVSADIMEPHRKNMARLIRAAHEVAIRTFARRVFNAAGKAAGAVLERKATEDEINTIVRDFSDEYTAVKVVRVSDTTKAHIINAVQQGLADEDATLDTIARLIREKTSGAIGANRAAVIARTETHNAAQAGNVAAADSLGIPGMKKEWVAVEDERTRPDHEAVDGTAVKMDDQFNVGGAMLDHPGDPDGPPEQVINCRCATVFSYPEE